MADSSKWPSSDVDGEFSKCDGRINVFDSSSFFTESGLFHGHKVYNEPPTPKVLIKIA